VERELNTYGQNGEVVGLVMGAYGEFSSSVALLGKRRKTIVLVITWEQKRRQLCFATCSLGDGVYTLIEVGLI
jgi:hypothetical protein